jgi:large subunit ribosomal protein L3
MKRYNFQGGPASHGSHFHRRPGSIGCRATPARVFANKKMPGQMGSDQVTVQNIVVLEVNTQDGYMLIKGSVPGSKNGFIKIAKAVKKS